MKNITLSIIGGIILSLTVILVIFYIDISFTITPFIDFIKHFRNNPINYVNAAIDAVSFIYMPLSIIIVATIMSLFIKKRRYYYCLLSVSPIIIIEYLFFLLYGTMSLITVIKNTYLALSYIILSYYIGYVFDNIIYKDSKHNTSS